MAKKKKEVLGKERIQAGYRSASEFCKLAGINRENFYYYRRTGVVPDPSHSFKGSIRLYYSPEEVLAMAEVCQGWAEGNARQLWAADFDSKVKKIIKGGK